MDYLISICMGYLLGSFPTAFFILKKAKEIDITNSGSGNVGAYNSYEVSKSKTLGLLVLLIDALKGLLSVYLIIVILPRGFTYPALSLIFAIFSHCYNPWIYLKGGRGLATAAGGVILLFPILLFIWGIVWAIVYLIKKDIIWGNILATIFSLIIITASPDIAYKYTFPKADSVSTMVLFVSALLIIIFSRHIEPLKDLIKINNLISVKGKNEQ